MLLEREVVKLLVDLLAVVVLAVDVREYHGRLTGCAAGAAAGAGALVVW